MTAMVTNRPYKTPICMYSHGDIPSVRECLKLHHILTNQILFFPFKKKDMCVCVYTHQGHQKSADIRYPGVGSYRQL